MDALEGDMSSLEAASRKWDAAYGQKDTTILATLLADDVMVHPGELGEHMLRQQLTLHSNRRVCPN